MKTPQKGRGKETKTRTRIETERVGRGGNEDTTEGEREGDKREER